MQQTFLKFNFILLRGIFLVLDHLEDLQSELKIASM